MIQKFTSEAQRLIEKGLLRRAATVYRKAAFDFNNPLSDGERATLCARALILETKAKTKASSHKPGVAAEPFDYLTERASCTASARKSSKRR